MPCEQCGIAEAAHRVTERTATGFVEIRSCDACCRTRAGWLDPPPEGLYTLVDREAGTSRVVTLDEIVTLFRRQDET